MNDGLNVQEMLLLIEALERAAARRESMARFHPQGKNAGEHDRKSLAMRKLRNKLNGLIARAVTSGAAALIVFALAASVPASAWAFACWTHCTSLPGGRTVCSQTCG